MQSFSIIIPAYNEQKRLPPTLSAILSYLEKQQYTFSEVIVVDDGSNDDTAAIVKNLQREYPTLRLLRNPGNKGKGYAVRYGMLDAVGKWLLLSDADLSAPIEELETLHGAAEREGASVVIGSRSLEGSLIGVRQPLFRQLSGKLFNRMMRLLIRLPFKDTQCGFTLYRAEAAREIFSRQRMDRFSFDVESLCIAHLHGIAVAEVPVRWSNVEGTTVSMMQGVKSFLDLFKIRWFKLSGRYR